MGGADWTLVQRKDQDLHQFLLSLTELYGRQELSDVRVRCEDGDILTHSLLLSAVSPFLHRLLLDQRSPYCEDSASIVLLLPDVKHRDLQHLLGCMVGLESCQSQSEELQCLMQLLQLQSETKVESPTGQYVGENSAEEGEVKQVVKSTCSDDDDGKGDQISKSDGFHMKPPPGLPEDITDCDRNFSSKAPRERHRTDQVGDRGRPQYDDCDKIVVRKSRLDPRIRRQHAGEKPLKRFACDVESCGKTFKINKNMLRHKRVDHGVVPGGNLSQIVECDVCGKRCGDRNQLEKHKIKHTTEKNFICSVCGKRLKRQNSLDLHMRHHTGTRSYECDQCDQSYFTASALRNHKVCKHTVLTESWLCTFCGKAFTKKANLEQHVTLHTGEKKYQCSHCEKRFRSHSVYQNHLRAHLGKKEFVCQYCGKAFMQKSHLARHTATHTGERRHACPVCAKTFIEPGDVRKHLRTHSKEMAALAPRPVGEGDVKPAVATWNIPAPPPAILEPADRPVSHVYTN